MAIISPTLHTAGIGALESALRRALELDRDAGAQLESLEGCIFKLACTRPELELFMRPEAGSIRLMGYWDGEVTTSIRGTASDFANLATAGDPTAELINGELELEGNSAPLIELQKILARLDMDWEAPLVGTFGDVAGHQLANAMRGLFGWGRHASSSFLRQLEEFIHEEARLAPSRLEVEDFQSDLEELGQRVDRLQARLRKLVAKGG